MRVLCCGPQSSGTRLLARILRTSGAEVTHKTLPDRGIWWGWDEQRQQYCYPGQTYFPCDRAVAILRDPDIATASVEREGKPVTSMGAAWDQQEARRLIAAFPDSALVIAYRDLIDHPDEVLERISAYLGLPVSLSEPLVDGDVKYGAA